MRIYVIASSLLLFAASVALAAGSEPGPRYVVHPEIDWPMYDQPRLPDLKEIKQFHPGLLDLWLAALQRPHTEMRVRAADAIAEAHRLGMAGVLEKTGSALIALLNTPDLDPIVYRGVAETLVVLDAREAAAVLLEHNRSGGREIVMTTDRAMARWDYKPARPIWRQRAEDAAGAADHRVSAIHALAETKDAESLDALQRVALDRSGLDAVRLAAAAALGRLAEQGLADAAAQLANHEDATLTDRFVAARMLGSHTGKSAVAVLRQLATDAESAVATVALRRMVQIDPLLLASSVEPLSSANNSNHRTTAIDVLHAQRNETAVARIAVMLADPNNPVREHARRRLMELAQHDSLAAAVKQHTAAMLDSDAWQAVEQAAYIVGRLDHEPAAGRLTELLDHPRYDARLAVIAALRWINVTLAHAAVFGRAEEVQQQRAPVTEVPRDSFRSIRRGFEIHIELAHLCQTLGEFRYQQADPFLRTFVPKSPKNPVARAAAIWALGMLHQDRPDQALAGQLAGRITDVLGQNPEDALVRRMSALTIGRMKAPGHQNAMYPFYEKAEQQEKVGQACRWAIVRSEGQDLSLVPRPIKKMRGWFLEPIPED